MSLRLVLVTLALAVASTYGERVTCREVKQSNGQVSFDCVSVVPQQDLEAKNAFILWLKSNREGQNHALNIDVPNYSIQDTIQAAAKGVGANSHTNINVNLAKPEVSYIAQKEEKLGDHTQSFDVNLQYDRLQGQSVHFADEGAGSQRYSTLQGRIEEPSGSASFGSSVSRTNTNSGSSFGSVRGGSNTGATSFGSNTGSSFGSVRGGNTGSSSFGSNTGSSFGSARGGNTGASSFGSSNTGSSFGSTGSASIGHARTAHVTGSSQSHHTGGVTGTHSVDIAHNL